MEKLKLTVAERLGLNNLLTEIYSPGKGGADYKTMMLIFKIMEKVMIESEEAKRLNLKQVGNNVTWDPKRAKEQEIEFSKDQIDIIREALKVKNEKKLFTLADRNILGLAEKLNLEL